MQHHARLLTQVLTYHWMNVEVAAWLQSQHSHAGIQ